MSVQFCNIKGFFYDIQLLNYDRLGGSWKYLHDDETWRNILDLFLLILNTYVRSWSVGSNLVEARSLNIHATHDQIGSDMTLEII